MTDASRAKRLELAREAAGFDSAAEAARALDIPEPTYQAHENGSRGFTADSGQRYAKRFGCDFAWLMTGAGVSPKSAKGGLSQIGQLSYEGSLSRIKDAVKVPVIGSVQAGQWDTALQWREEERYETLVRLNPKYRGLDPVAFQVDGPSMNRVYPPGTVVVCISYIDLGRDPIHGERVVVQRRRGDQVEASLKEFRRDDDGRARLWPLSSHPRHQTPLFADGSDGADGATEVLVTHKVISAQIDEP